jgi:hypothetical protein
VRSEVIITMSADLARRSLRSPNALLVHCQHGEIARNGCSVRAAPQVIKVVLALAARPDTLISDAELTELMFGDRFDGGPEDAAGAIRTLTRYAKYAFAAVGYLCQHHYGSRVSARPVLFEKREAA